MMHDSRVEVVPERLLAIALVVHVIVAPIKVALIRR